MTRRKQTRTEPTPPLAEPLGNPADMALRNAEQQLARARAALRYSELRRAQAEEELSSANQRLELLLATQERFSVAKLRHRRARANSHTTAIICINDLHCEENVDPQTIDGANHYSLDICDRRLRRTWEKSIYLLEFARGISRIDELVVWLGGDLINGYIHEECQEGNFLGPAEAIAWIQERIATGLQHLLSHAGVKRITVPTSYGNHGRSLTKRRISTGYKSSWEFLAFTNLAWYFRNEPRVEFKIEKGYHNWLAVQGHSIRFHHGDAVRFGGGVGGVHIPLRRKIAQWNKRRRADLDILGHFHQYADDSYYVLSASLVGYNAYAVDIGAEYQPPTQTFLAIDRGYGKIMALPIFCEESGSPSRHGAA